MFICVKVLLNHSKSLKAISKKHDLCKTILSESGCKDRQKIKDTRHKTHDTRKSSRFGGGRVGEKKTKTKDKRQKIKDQRKNS
jgi:hypothetical protein